MKQCRNDSKQTVNFRVVDVTFFKKDNDGQLRQLPRNASKEEILDADSATLRLTNQKNGWKGVCINHHVNGDSYLCPVKAIGRRVVHIREHSNDGDIGLCAFFNNGNQFDVNDDDIDDGVSGCGGSCRAGTMAAATMIQTPMTNMTSTTTNAIGDDNGDNNGADKRQRRRRTSR